MSEKIEKNKIFSILLGIILAGCYLLADRMSTNLFLFSFSYIAQNITPYLVKLVLLAVLAAFIVLLVKHKGRLNYGILACYLAVYLAYLIPTLAHGGSLERWLDCMFWSTLALCFTTVLFSAECTAKLYVRVISDVYLVLATLNLLFILLPQLYSLISEWREEYFIGFHTLLGYPLVTGALFALLDWHLNNRKWATVSYLVLFFANMLLVHAGVALLGTMLFALYLLPPVRKLVEKCDLLVFLGIIVALFCVLMFALQPFTELTPVKYFLENVLHKDITLSGRLYIWQLVLEEVKQYPIFGWGMLESTQLVFEPSFWNNAWVHAHNAFLQTLHEGGLFALLLGLAMVGHTAAILRKCEDRQLAGIFKIILFVVLLMLQGDFYAYYTWYPLAFVCHLACTLCPSSQARLAQRNLEMHDPNVAANKELS